MNTVQLLSSQPWVERLGWTLVHFLWQGLSIAILYAAIRFLARTASPHARYLLACAALGAMAAAPLATWALMRAPDAGAAAVYRTGSLARAASITGTGTSSAGTTLPALAGAAVSRVQPTGFPFWVVTVWLAGVLVCWVRLVGGWAVAARMRSMLVRRAPPEWQEILGRLGGRIGLSRPVQLLISALVQTPTVVGWLRPVVLVPVGALGGLPADQLEALLLHELAHIRRHDYLVNILQSIAEALLFYHPAVWWVSGHIRREREQCCDDLAVSVSGDVLTYARALAQLERYRPPDFSLTVAANGGSLSHRIARLLGQSRPPVRSGLGPGVLTVALLLADAVYGLLAQPATHSAIPSVSIRRSAFNWSERSKHPMGLGVDSSLLFMIQFTYATHNAPYAGHTIPLPASQVEGGPPWINAEGWDIVTKSRPTDPNWDLQMWQALLADKFRLRLHRETRELPIYILSAAKNGLHLPAPPKDLGCVSFPAFTKPHPAPGQVDCGYISGPGSGFGGAARGELGLRGRKLHMSDLISELALILDRPISDHTGFTGDFDVVLNFAPDQALQGFGFGAGDASSVRPAADTNLPNIFAALEQQLGLKLVPAKGPVEVLVVDHAEEPAAN